MIYRFEGNQRNGKTLGAVQWALLMQEMLWNFYRLRSEIYANFPCTFQGWQFDTWEDLVGVDNGIILFDEIDTAVDSRNFKSEDQTKFTHWFKQLGKRGNNFLYTAQRDNLVEKRVREQTDFIVKCTKNWLTGLLEQEWLDSQAGQEPERLIPIRKYVNYQPSVFYSLYDSFALVKTTMKR